MIREEDWDSSRTLIARFEAAMAASRADPAPGWDIRRDRLERLARMLRADEAGVIEAIATDFGQRPAADTRMAEIFPSYAEIAHALRHGKGWMRPRKVPTAVWFRPGRSRIVPQPKGLAGIIGPWNYPLFLMIGPLVGAFAAGNRALVKTSEYAPNFAAWLAGAAARHFAPDELAVIRGGPQIGAEFSVLPFDHLFFTGNAEIGRKVMQAAARNLTPVTLELGGKSPVLVTENADLDRAVARVMTGKMLNAGQTCVAPDHVLIARPLREGFIAGAREWMARHYPDIAGNPDVTHIIDDRQFGRLVRMRDDAVARGAELHRLSDHEAGRNSRLFPPLIVTGAPEDSLVMTEEIFGPILPVIAVESTDEMVSRVNAGPRPLAAYYFSQDRAEIEALSARIVSGGACYNETIMHVAQTDLPFGGVGASGMGHYHGRYGFDTFSHLRGTFIQSRINGLGLLTPPYGARFRAMMTMLTRLALPRRLR
ncbi:coniferyl aldehyde dehydrogenase [Paracoccus stylophorae]|uniref:Aldehyde dehydrogenase n=1 Tax=Paracoccus stylophorae TaxID=659350 RepID=A0ABY7SWH2_9RHOB|nr:coniferyl aldehyde dehydrogenase [Paracoccus stylophorae]WCR10737.1 coniferyl aldehyde dehydrogenase [Paracoccus stylophorae]